jgi:hypothetical protein
LWSRPGPLRPGLDHCPPSAMDLWSMGLAEYRRAHMPRCSLWASGCLPEAWKRLVQPESLMRARNWTADREAAEDDLSFRPSIRKAAEPGQPMTKERAKL